MPTITLGTPSKTPRNVGSQRVYLRAKWSDAWVQVSDLHATEITWATQPNMPSAKLVWFYGRIANYSQSFATVSKLTDRERWYVKIEVDCEEDGNGGWNIKQWIGVLTVTNEDHLGRADLQNNGNDIGSGQQTFTALGLESLLRSHWIRSMQVDDAGEQTIDRAADFNEAGRPNMTTAMVGNCNIFSNDYQDVAEWDSYNIALYLLNKQTHKDDGNAAVPVWNLDPTAFPHPLPINDAPTVRQLHRNTLDVLNEVIPAERLYTWWADATLGSPMVKVATLTPDPITAPPDATATDIPANTTTIDVVFDRDPTASSTLTLSAMDVYDRVIVRGARRRSCFTVSYQDGNCTDGWESALTTAYNAGASGAGDYPAADDLLGRRKRDVEARSREELRDVYARFIIPHGWEGTAGCGLGDTGAMSTVFPSDADPTIGVAYNKLSLTVEQSLPLLTGIDYSGNAIGDGPPDEAGGGAERPPFVAWRLPPEDPSGSPPERRYQSIDTIGRSAMLPDVEDQSLIWSCDVSVPPDDRAIELRVTGASQHVIASFDFVALDHDPPMPAYTNFREMLVTVSVTEDRFCEAQWPDALPIGADHVRTLVIDAGDDYHLDRVHPCTVVGIDEYGDLVRSNGGYVRDDRPTLRTLARIAHAWYGAPRVQLSVSTEYLDTRFELGQMITTINVQGVGHRADNYHEINSVITEIQITWPMTDTANQQPDPPQMRISTNHGELNPLALLPR